MNKHLEKDQNHLSQQIAGLINKKIHNKVKQIKP